MTPNSTHFNNRLRQWRRRWLADRCREVLLLLVPRRAILFLAALAALDLLLAWPPEARYTAGVLASAAFLLWTALDLRRALRKGPAETAKALDAAGDSPRRRILAAYELSRGAMKTKEWETPDDGLTSFCIDQAVRKASAVLDAIPPHGLRSPQRRAQWRRRLAQALLVMAVLLVFPGGRTSLQRVTLPWRDVPPWSRFEFQIRPDPVQAVYGQGAELFVTLVGGDVPTGEVELVTRDASGRHVSTCFREGPRRYTQRIQNVTTPLEFCFRTGRARSRWRQVELLLRPRILEAEFTVRPPSYSRRARSTFPAGSRPLEALVGSDIELTLKANRALADGTMTLVSGAYAENVETVPGEVSDSDANSAVFRWTLNRDARAEARIIGEDGLAVVEDFEFHQIAVPDRPPDVHLDDIPPFSLATPRSEITISAEASDDLHVQRLDLVRGLRGFRDRTHSLGPENPTPEHQAVWIADLARLGAAPGDTLEFFAEARDTNPTLNGIGNSDIARVEVISEDKYAAILRRGSDLAQFATRFTLASKQLERLRTSVRDLREAQEKGQSTTEELEVQRKAAAEEARKTVDLFEKLSADFAIYELERRLTSEMADFLGDLKVAENHLRNTPADSPKFADNLQYVAEEKLATREMDVTKIAEFAEIAQDIGEALKELAGIQTVVREQEWLVRMIGRAAGGQAPDLPLLNKQADPERGLAEQLQQTTERLRTLAKRIPQDYAPFPGELEALATHLEDQDIAELMSDAAEAAEAGRAREARDKAVEALQRLRSTLTQSCRGDSCLGQTLGGNPGFCQGTSLSETIRQMLDGLRAPGQKQGRGGAGGAGAGMGGSAEDGYWMAAVGQRNVPMYGPERLQVQAQSQAQPINVDADGDTRGEATTEKGSDTPGNTLTPDRDIPPPKKQHRSKTIHPRYREALKRYYRESQTPE